MDDAGPGREDLAKLLEKFPGPMTLTCSKWKWLRLLIIGAVFVTLGVWMIEDAASFSDAPLARLVAQFPALLGLHLDAAAAVAITGWVTCVFFGLGLVFCFVNLLPGAAELTLNSDGFTMSSLFRQKSYNWTNVDGFAVAKVQYGFGVTKFVGYDDLLAAESRVARANVALAGRNSGLSDTYGMSVERLADLMSAWRERALAISRH